MPIIFINIYILQHCRSIAFQIIVKCRKINCCWPSLLSWKSVLIDFHLFMWKIKHRSVIRDTTSTSTWLHMRALSYCKIYFVHNINVQYCDHIKMKYMTCASLHLIFKCVQLNIVKKKENCNISLSFGFFLYIIWHFSCYLIKIQYKLGKKL